MSSFPVVLKHLRTTAKMTQPELAQKLGVSRSAISMYELGSREPDFETLEAIADIFNVDMNTLISKEKAPTPEGEREYSDDAPDENYIILSRNAKKLSPEKRKQLLDMAKIMFKEEFKD